MQYDDELLDVIFILCGDLFFSLISIGWTLKKGRIKNDRHQLIDMEYFVMLNRFIHS